MIKNVFSLQKTIENTSSRTIMGGSKLLQCLQRAIWQYLSKLQRDRLVFPVVILLKIYPKVYLHTGKMTIFKVIYCSNNKRLESNYISFRKGLII